MRGTGIGEGADVGPVAAKLRDLLERDQDVVLAEM